MRKRIHNPKTKKYYALQQRTTTIRHRGQIKGPWRQPEEDMIIDKLKKQYDKLTKKQL